jgi:two-component system, OmpR family, alkaline phosphatase synthesis response regulator PhoP
MNLALVGHTSEQVDAGNAARESLANRPYDLVLLDIMLPEIEGFDLLRYVPDGTPVICVTARANLSDRVQGLNQGADDYIVKPFETVELLARVEAVLRRTNRAFNHFTLDGTVVNLDSRVVTVDGCTVDLTLQEYALLEVLIQHQNMALSREKLLQLAWGYDYVGETRTVDVHIQKLRQKLGWDRRIRTVYKMGYRLEVEP